MLNLWLPSLFTLVGFVGLVWSADRFVGGSAALAKSFGVSKIVIGLTIVAFGTSAPEVLVSINATLKGAGDLAVGNALGSNLANIGLVLGISALLASLPIQRHLLKCELPILLLVTVIAGWFLMDAQLTRLEGSLLLLGLPCIMALLIWSRRHHPEEVDEEIPTMSRAAAWRWFLIGLVLLIVSAELLVRGASQLALAMGVSPLVIGLTVVAVGTSLPELAASIASIVKGHYDIAIGNVVGSNLFNLLAVMAIAAVISPLQMEPAVFSRDYAAMGLITLALGGLIYLSFAMSRHTTGTRLGRMAGAVFLAIYAGYFVILFT